MCIPRTVSPSSRLWVLRLQWPASLYAISVLSSRWLSSFSFLFVLDWLAVDWFVILPVETVGEMLLLGEHRLQHHSACWPAQYSVLVNDAPLAL